MENPFSWTELEHLINNAIKDHGESVDKMIVGLSLPAFIASRLRQAGYTKVDEKR